MTLREKAQQWLKNYKAGDAYGGNVLSLEEMAAVVSEYLYETDPRKKAEDTSEIIKSLPTKAELLHGCKDGDSYREKYDKCRAELEKALERNANLEQCIGKLAEVQHVTASTLDQYEKELADIKAKLNNSELTRESLAYDLARARSKNEAYEFVICCNSMSGAEVRP